MERFNALGRGTQIMLIASVLLLIDSFFRWQEVEFDLGPLGGGSAGVSGWHGFLGVVMALLTIVLLARIVARLAAVEIPIPVSFAMTSAVLAFLILACALLKNLTDDYSTFWSYIGVGLAFLIAVGAWLEVKEAGGMEHLKSQIPSSGEATPAAAEPAVAAAPPAPPPPPATPQSPPPPPPPMSEAAASGTAAPESEASTDEPSTERET